MEDADEKDADVAEKDFEEEIQATRALLKAPENVSAKAVAVLGEHFRSHMSTKIDPNCEPTPEKPMPFDAKMRDRTSILTMTSNEPKHLQQDIELLKGDRARRAIWAY